MVDNLKKNHEEGKKISWWWKCWFIFHIWKIFHSIDNLGFICHFHPTPLYLSIYLWLNKFIKMEFFSGFFVVECFHFHFLFFLVFIQHMKFEFEIEIELVYWLEFLFSIIKEKKPNPIINVSIWWCSFFKKIKKKIWPTTWLWQISSFDDDDQQKKGKKLAKKTKWIINNQSNGIRFDYEMISISFRFVAK